MERALPIPDKTSAHLPLEASKWQKLSVLLDPIQMEELLNACSPFFLCKVGQIVKKGEEILSLEAFLKAYSRYSQELFSGNIPDLSLFRDVFFSAATKDLSAFFSVPLEEQKHLVKVCKPSLQFQALQVRFSPETMSVYQNVFGKNALPFGLTFSYPHLVRTEEGDVVKSREGEFANSELFKEVQHWLRKNTSPAMFLFEGKKVVTPIKIGKGVKEKMGSHPVLRSWQLQFL